MAVAVWVFAMTFSMVTHLLGLSYNEIRKSLKLYLFFFGLVFYIATFYCYGRIYIEIRQVKRRITVENTFQNGHTALRAGSKEAKTMSMVISALTLCYLPYFMVSMPRLSGIKELMHRHNEKVRDSSGIHCLHCSVI